jgi:diguanylate cyclase
MEPSALSFSGEFRSQISEAEYRAEHLREFIRQARLGFFSAALINPLFLLSDWRFRGNSHFIAAISSRAALEIASIVCLVLIAKARTFRQHEIICSIWACLVIPASAILVTPHTDIALLVTFILPVVFYLVIPVSFQTSLIFGMACSAFALVAYMSSAQPTDIKFGLVAGMVMSNVVLAIVLSQSKRLRRLQWDATRAERAANRKLSQNRDMLQKFLHAIPAPFVIAAKDSGKLIQANEAACACLGAASPADLMRLENYIDAHDWAKLTAMVQLSGQASGFETRLRLPDGTVKDVLLATTTVPIGDKEAILTVFVDITSRKALEIQMKKLAHTDPLTGLPNRSRFFTVAADEIKRSKRYDRPLSVFMIDIDFFKQVNDTYGHEFGDLTLQAFARLCRHWIREQDTIARLGGEEFGLLLPETDEVHALALADRLRVAVKDLRVGHLARPITISIGVSEVQPDEATVVDALSRADQALYSAKRSGRNLSVLYRQAKSVEQHAACG